MTVIMFLRVNKRMNFNLFGFVLFCFEVWWIQATSLSVYGSD